MKTPYSIAWEKFSMTNEFVTAVRLSTGIGEDSKYAINRLRIAFDAGWNSKTSSILEALNQMSDRGGEAHDESI